MRQSKWIGAAALAVLLAPAALWAQDLTLKGTTTTNGREVQTIQYISPAGTRSSMGDGTEVILRVDEKKIYIIHAKQKNYNEMTFDDLQKMAATASAASQNIPPEAAAMMKKMMGGGAGGDEVTVTHVGPGGTIAGYATEQYHIVMGTTEVDQWMAPAIAYPPVFYQAMKAIVPSTPMFDMKKLYEELGKLKGVPLKSVISMKMMGQNINTTTLVTAVDKAPIPAEAFQVPAGFKAVPMK